jgi:hypothetical protein
MIPRDIDINWYVACMSAQQSDYQCNIVFSFFSFFFLQISGVANGLEYLHAQGMAHGDLHGVSK